MVTTIALSSVRRAEIPWSQLEYFLRREGFIRHDEEIELLTLTKPRSILFRLTRPLPVPELKGKKDKEEE